jgi:hypothetical protein
MEGSEDTTRLVPPTSFLAVALALRRPREWTLLGRTHSTVTLTQFDVCIRVSLPRYQGHEPKIYTFISVPCLSFDDDSVLCGVQTTLHRVCIGRVPLRHGLRNLKDDEIVRAIAEELDNIAGEAAERRVAAVRARLALDIHGALPKGFKAKYANAWIKHAYLSIGSRNLSFEESSLRRLRTIISGVRQWSYDRLAPIEILPVPLLTSAHERIRAAEIADQNGILPFQFKP